MSKRNIPLGHIETPLGRVPVKQPAVARALEGLQGEVERLVALGQRAQHDLLERNKALAALQNHWWTRLGEALRIVRIP